MATLTVALYGGLGNQMFQYAMGRAIAARYHAALHLDLYGFEFDKRYRRNFDLSYFKIAPDIVHVRRPVGFRMTRMIRRFSELVPTIARIVSPSLVVEPSPEFHPELLQLDSTQRAYVMGYWQDERYFSEYSDTIKREFTLAQDLSETNRRIADRICSAPTPVAVHLRLHGVDFGDDSIKLATAEKRGLLLSARYYVDALRELESRVNSPTCFVFSDHPEWARDHFRDRSNAIFLERGRGPDYEDIPLMSMCKHHVIANSSFSWWGAWLAGGEGQVVVAPRSAKKYTPNIPERWLRL